MAVSTKRAATQLVRQAWSARTMHDVEALLKGAARERPIHWRAVGDRNNNIGTIRLASDPALALVERVTNGMDALLELGHQSHVSDTPRSPREAARMWFGVPTAGLADMLETERRALGEKIQVILEESGEAKRPTVVVDDRGIGQHPEEFHSTLLSLNENNKVGQPWTMGTYGQGGSATYGFSRATIIVSRRHPDFLSGQPDRIGWTIVREEETDPALDILPTYKYLVHQDGTVFGAHPGDFPDLPYGTRVVQVAYDLQGWSGPFTTGIWQFFHGALFDPVLPFLVTGNRGKESSYGSRIIIGNKARLDRPDKAKGELEVAHTDSTEVDLTPRFGEVTINYWVVRRSGAATSASDAAAGYVQAGNAVSMTLFGQRQDVQSRSWIKDRAKLPFLFKNLIVQIDADRLTPVAKREVFASTRERATDSELKTTIYDRLITALLADDELKRLDHEEKERLLEKSTGAASEKVRKRLAKFIQTRLKDVARPGGGSQAGGQGGTRTRKPGPVSPPRDTDDSSLHNVPTKLRFKSSTIRVPQGGGGYTWVEIDAKNGYLPAQDHELSIRWEGGDPGDRVRLVARSRLLGGLSRWFFKAESDATLGSNRLTADLFTARGALTDSTTIEVIAPPTATPGKSGSEPETGPRVEWATREQWDQLGMDAVEVGAVTEDEEETIIWINRRFSSLEKALSGPRLTAEQITVRSERYQYPVACGLWLQDFAQKNAAGRPDDRYLKQERQRLAEAVLIAIDPDVDAAIEQSDS